MESESGSPVYEKVKGLGRGAFGAATLYRRGEELVVWKEVEAGSGTRRAAVEREIAVLVLLNHPCIVAYLNQFDTPTKFYIEMEYADGTFLFSLICFGLVGPWWIGWRRGPVQEDREPRRGPAGRVDGPLVLLPNALRRELHTREEYPPQVRLFLPFSFPSWHRKPSET